MVVVMSQAITLYITERQRTSRVRILLLVVIDSFVNVPFFLYVAIHKVTTSKYKLYLLLGTDENSYSLGSLWSKALKQSKKIN